jgi:hypothetical protein
MADRDSPPNFKVLAAVAIAGVAIVIVCGAILMNAGTFRFRALSEPASPGNIPNLPTMPRNP